uniref:Uncharacterized protein n=1 Tax=Arundo donax TaxID=35708 RepID=A0A0A9FNE3_ARUDO
MHSWQCISSVVVQILLKFLIQWRNETFLHGIPLLQAMLNMALEEKPSGCINKWNLQEYCQTRSLLWGFYMHAAILVW